MKKLVYGIFCFVCTTTIFVVLVFIGMCIIISVYPDMLLEIDVIKMASSFKHINTTVNDIRPIVLENQTIYLGEDARFFCGAIFDGTILWLKNNEEVVNGTNRYITLEVANSQVSVTTNLTIYSVTEDDFGMYECYVLFDSVKPEFNKDDNSRQYNLLYKVGEYHLLQEKPRIITLHIVPGTLVSVSVYFRHLREKDDISFRCTLKGQDIQSFDTQCSYFAGIYAFALKNAGFSVAYNNVTYWKTINVGQWKGDIGFIWICISPSMYGVYQITILRKVYNKSGGIQWTEKIDYHTKVYIKPKEYLKTEKMSNNTNRTVRDYNEDCWSDEELEPESCKYIKPLVVSHFDKNMLYDRLITRNIVILVCVPILVSSILLFVIWPFFQCKLLQFYCVISRSGNQGLAGIQVNPGIQYHIYISSSSFFADRSFTALNILPILKRLNLKVFFGQDDIPPGSLEITEISNSINKSLKCLVIASKTYIRNAIQNDFEINCILKTFSKCDLVLVNVDHCPIHKIFEKMYTVIKCSSDGLSEQNKTTLMQWAIKNREIIPNVTQQSWSSNIKRWIIYILLVYVICTWL